MRPISAAFTLIELLVVISVIAVLAGLVMGVVPVVRGAAESASCASNLRQLHLAVLAYASDNNGCLPYTKDTSTNQQSWDRDFLLPYAREQSGMTMTQITKESTSRSVAIYRCPTARRLTNGNGAGGCISDYGLNAYIFPSGTTTTPFEPATYREFRLRGIASNSYMITDTVSSTAGNKARVFGSPNDTAMFTSFGSDPIEYTRHRQAFNMLVFGGQVVKTPAATFDKTLSQVWLVANSVRRVSPVGGAITGRVYYAPWGPIAP